MTEDNDTKLPRHQRWLMDELWFWGQSFDDDDEEEVGNGVCEDIASINEAIEKGEGLTAKQTEDLVFHLWQKFSDEWD